MQNLCNSAGSAQNPPTASNEQVGQAWCPPRAQIHVAAMNVGSHGARAEDGWDDDESAMWERPDGRGVPVGDAARVRDRLSEVVTFGKQQVIIFKISVRKVGIGIGAMCGTVGIGFGLGVVRDAMVTA